MRIPSVTSNKLKLIAIMAMLFDHLVAVFVTHNTVLGMILRFQGRIVAPIMCFMIAEGYYKTSNIKRYIFRLFIFSVISHIPYNICFGYSLLPLQATSVMWSLTLGLIALTVVKTESLHFCFRGIALGVCCVLAITANWNYVAVLWIVVFGVFHDDFVKRIIGFCIVSILFHLLPTFMNFGFVHEGYPHWYQLGVFLQFPYCICTMGNAAERQSYSHGFSI